AMPCTSVFLDPRIEAWHVATAIVMLIENPLVSLGCNFAKCIFDQLFAGAGIIINRGAVRFPDSGWLDARDERLPVILEFDCQQVEKALLGAPLVHLLP